MGNVFKELKELDNKYKMVVSFLGNGKIDAFFIFRKNETLFKDPKGIIKDKEFSSLEEGLKYAGKNCDDVVFTAIDPADSVIIDKVYKKYGGYVSLNELKR